jgi:hypothetical protein
MLLSFLADPEYLGVLWTVIAVSVAVIAAHGVFHHH